MRHCSIANSMGANTFDYMKQFWRENEIQLFSAKEAQLYFFFLEECNRLYWHNPFGCSTQRITNNLGISRQTLCRLRKRLQDRGLIAYQEGKNNSSMPEYTLLMKADNRVGRLNVTPNGTPDGTLNGTANVTQDGTIIKTYKTENNISIIDKEEPLSLNLLQNHLCNNKEWMLSVKKYMSKRGVELDAVYIERQLEDFFLYLQTSGASPKLEADAQKHFVNWLMKRENKRENKQKSLSSTQVGVKLTDNNPDKFKDISGW
jgi:DNA-binding MarR family transcriptional regulator